MSTAPAEFQRLIDIVARLRAPDGCPWDREQTIDTLKPFVLEETYEVLEAIDAARSSRASARSSATFCSRRCSSRNSRTKPGTSPLPTRSRASPTSWCDDIRTSSAATSGEPALGTADQVRTRWEEIKAAGARGDRTKPKTLLGGVPEGLPALLRAYQIGVPRRLGRLRLGAHR